MYLYEDYGCIPYFEICTCIGLDVWLFTVIRLYCLLCSILSKLEHMFKMLQFYFFVSRLLFDFIILLLQKSKIINQIILCWQKKTPLWTCVQISSGLNITDHVAWLQKMIIYTDQCTIWCCRQWIILFYIKENKWLNSNYKSMYVGFLHVFFFLILHPL